MTTALWRIATPMGAGAIHPICIAAIAARRGERRQRALLRHLICAQHPTRSAESGTLLRACYADGPFLDAAIQMDIWSPHQTAEILTILEEVVRR